MIESYIRVKACPIASRVHRAAAPRGCASLANAREATGDLDPPGAAALLEREREAPSIQAQVPERQLFTRLAASVRMPAPLPPAIESGRNEDGSASLRSRRIAGDSRARRKVQASCSTRAV